MDERYQIEDPQVDILSYSERIDRIHILTLDPVLATDVCERIHHDPRMKNYLLARPRKTKVKDVVEEIEGMAKDTVYSRLLIIDVRRGTLSRLQWAYNTIVGYNRRDLNKLCHILLIGDGPFNLFWADKKLDVFVTYLASHRVDFHPAAFFFDPFLHYERGEIELAGIGEELILPDKIPKRLIPYFKKDESMKVDKIRRYFRAVDKDEELRKKRRRRLRSLYKKRIAEQFPEDQDRLRAWLSKKGIRLASERMHLYPFYFEDWVYDLMHKAAHH